MIDSAVDPLRDFAKDSARLVKRCHKPDRKGEYSPGFFFYIFSFFVAFVRILWALRLIWTLIGVIGWTEFTKVAVRTAIGFVVMGFVGFFVKLIFIPINNIIVGSG